MSSRPDDEVEDDIIGGRDVGSNRSEVEDDIVNGRDAGPNGSSVGPVVTSPRVTVMPPRFLPLGFLADGRECSAAHVASSPGTTSRGGDTFVDLAGGPV
jgi:hypothetical protein